MRTEASAESKNEDVGCCTSKTLQTFNLQGIYLNTFCKWECVCVGEGGATWQINKKLYFCLSFLFPLLLLHCWHSFILQKGKKLGAAEESLFQDWMSKQHSYCIYNVCLHALGGRCCCNGWGQVGGLGHERVEPSCSSGPVRWGSVCPWTHHPPDREAEHSNRTAGSGVRS